LKRIAKLAILMVDVAN